MNQAQETLPKDKPAEDENKVGHDSSFCPECGRPVKNNHCFFCNNPNN
jgi:predicted amidophosphoribosyltransferase